ncbi:phage holin family protein [Pyxidicoccus fallax]|uniref:Phage holin family protein n=1 Tax=Pyxidicoccus fallax TaxID=394095 RepID=A0A848LR52_9BACT|nr:phage holin family protein [Pyxidicoccus fallax]NMO20120.1 phage holin family protein [Pyxidicoccus fallax]NPC80839.1 phage holin family protein [Pyxidicoccus fallax]
MDEQKQKQGPSLMSAVMTQGKRLLKTEMELARKDIQEDTRNTARSTMLLGASAWMGMTGISALVIAAALALPRRPVRGALYTGLALVGGSLGVALAGLKTLPKKPMGRSREGLQEIVSTVSDTIPH